MTDNLKEPATTALLQRSKKLRGEMDGSMARLDRQCVTVMFQMEEALLKVLAERDALMSAVGNLIKVKGRYHTEQSFKALVGVYDAMKGTPT